MTPLKGTVLLLPLFAACTSPNLTGEAEPSGPPGESESKVIFCRPSRIFQSDVAYGVWDGLHFIGFAENGIYFEYRCSPGKHLFITEAETCKAIDADLAARKTYYVWITPRMGVFSPNVGFTPVSRDSDLKEKVVESLRNSPCCQTLPEIRADFEIRSRARIQRLKEAFEGARNAKAMKLLPEDGE